MFDMIMNLQKKYNEKYFYATNINPYSSRTLQKISWKNIKLDDIIKINDMTSQYKSWNNKTVLNIGIALSIFYWIFITVIVFSTIIITCFFLLFILKLIFFVFDYFWLFIIFPFTNISINYFFNILILFK